MFDQKHVSEVVNKINARTSELMSNSVVLELPMGSFATIRSSDYDGIFYAIPYSIWMGTTSEVVTNLESTEA